MYRVGTIAKMYGISRTTLLYYNSIGLLNPATRTEAGYRLYSHEDCEKLEQIISYRGAGLSTNEIKGLLMQQHDEEIISPLLKKLGDLNQEIKILKKQQMILIKLIKNRDIIKKDAMNEETFNIILEKANIKYEERMNWHAEFEEHSPQRHYDFLKSIGFDDEEIENQRVLLRNYLIGNFK